MSRWVLGPYLYRALQYIFSDIQNEIIDIFKYAIHEAIINEVKEAKYYLIISDSTRDITKTEMMSIAIRSVYKNTVKERFLGFIHHKQLGAENKCQNLVEFLNKLNYDFINIISQCYDGCTVMSGRVHGLQSRFMKYAPKAIYIHCYAHNLNFALLDSLNSLPFANNFFQLIKKLYVFMSSGINPEIKSEAQVETYGQITNTLKRLIETRWSCNYDSILAIDYTFASLLLALSWLCNSKNSEHSVTAKGLSNQVKNLSFVSGLKIVRNLLSKTNELSKQLQS
jgi:hypothetical protein